MNEHTPHRQAVYFAPALDHPLWLAGCEWLGRDASRADDDHRGPARELARNPWRYGFHGTLKSPLRLRGSQDEWLAAVAAIAASTARFQMPALEVDWLGDFIAIRPIEGLAIDHPLRRLTDACVLELDRFRSPLAPDELACRKASLSSDRHRDYLERHGYPYVLDEWRFHMTLSDSLAELGASEQAALKQQARKHFAVALALPLACEDICLYAEPEPRAPLVLTHRFALAPGSARE